jgi:uncharacterized damage-inducible protein DinB
MTYYGGKELARSFRVVRRNTLIIAEEIPVEQYGFRPTPECRSVAENLAHIAASSHAGFEGHVIKRIQTFIGVDFKDRMRERRERESRLTTRADILAALRSDGEDWGTFLDGVTEPLLAEVITFPEPAVPPTKSRFEMILSIKEHEMHHRAQLMLVQRLLGLVPHLTREREAWAARA